MSDANKRTWFFTALSGLALVAITTFAIGCTLETQEPETVTQTTTQTTTKTTTQTVTTTPGAVTETTTTTAPGTTKTVTVKVPAPTEEPTSTEEPELVIELALIYDALVSFDESSPPQVFVYIKGGLPDSCTTLHEITIEYLDLPPKIHHGGQWVKITATTERPKDIECTQVYNFFEEYLTLDIYYIPGETYILEVNGAASDFQVP
jgi:ABC-type transport system substrate-binding protein